MWHDSNLDTHSDDMKPILPGKREWLHESVGVRGAYTRKVEIFRGTHGWLEGKASGGHRDLILMNKKMSAVRIMLPCWSGTLMNVSAC